jgi:hypothetical protein
LSLDGDQNAKRTIVLRMAADDNDDNNEKKKNEKETEYRNVATMFLSNFMGSNQDGPEKTNNANVDEDNDRLGDIDFSAPKFDNSNGDLELFAQLLDYELYNSEWFVTGNVSPTHFRDDFIFQDPDVKLQGIE